MEGEESIFSQLPTELIIHTLRLTTILTLSPLSSQVQSLSHTRLQKEALHLTLLSSQIRPLLLPIILETVIINTQAQSLAFTEFLVRNATEGNGCGYGGWVRNLWMSCWFEGLFLPPFHLLFIPLPSFLLHTHPQSQQAHPPPTPLPTSEPPKSSPTARASPP